MNPSDYKSTESIKNVVNLQDPLRYSLGKIFVETDLLGARSDEEEESRFSILNSNRLLRHGGGNQGSFPINGERDPEISLWLPRPDSEDLTFDDETGLIYESVTISRANIQAHNYYDLSVTPEEANFIDSPLLAAGNQYLMSLFPSEDKTFEETRFKTHAAFHRSELDHMETFPKFYAEAKVIIPAREEIFTDVYDHSQQNLERQSGYYQIRSHERKNLKNIYEGFLSSSLAIEDGYRPDFYFDPEEAEVCPEGVVVEKYPSDEVALIGRLNDLIFEEVEEEGPTRRWIDVNSDGFVEISFRMPDREESNWARFFTGNGSDTVLLSMLDGMHTSPPEGNVENTQIYDTLYAYNLEMSILDQATPSSEDDFYMDRDGDRYYSPNEKTVFDYRPRKVDHVFKHMKEWADTVFPTESPAVQARNFRRLFSRPDFPLLFRDSSRTFSRAGRNVFVRDAKLAITESRNEFYNSLYNFSNHLVPRWGNAMQPEQIFKTKVCPSEIIAFRMEKINTFTGQVLKEFYFFNNPDTTDFTFIDNEVSIGGKYKYNIYAINLVAGVQYRYLAPEISADLGPGHQDPQGRIRPGVTFQFETKPFQKIVETPYFSQDVMFVDLPPVHPSVRLHKMSSDEEENAHFQIIFEPRIDNTSEVPMALRPGDQEIISKMLEAQSFISDSERPPGHLKYSSDTKPTHFEMLVLSKPPEDYSSFEQADYYETTAESAYFNFIAPENQDRYMIFRTRDYGGISNPGHMFRFRFNKYGDGSYYEFEIYEPDDAFNLARMSCDRYLSISPAQIQKAYNFGIEGQPEQRELLELLESAPNLADFNIGLAPSENSIWGRNFKIRLRSQSTGRMIDFNFNYSISAHRDNQESLDPARADAEDVCGSVNTIEDKNNNVKERILSSRRSITSAGRGTTETGRGSNSGNADRDY